MNFKIFSNTTFSVGIDIYSRTCYVLKKSNGKIKISNVLNGAVLFDNINPSDITINDEPMTKISKLQEIVYNRNCNCDNEQPVGEKKIFDKTFDKTFE